MEANQHNSTTESGGPGFDLSQKSLDSEELSGKPQLERAYFLFSEDFIQLARDIAPILRAQAGNPENVEVKPDGSLVTKWDKELERLIVEIWNRHMPDGVFLGEELEQLQPLNLDQVQQANLLGICDPIDGTRNFVEGRYWYGSCFGTAERQPGNPGHFLASYGALIVPQENLLYLTEGKRVAKISLDDGSKQYLTCPQRNGSQERMRVSGHGLESQYLSEQALADGRIHIVYDRASIADALEVMNGQQDFTLLRGSWWDVAAIVALADKLAVRAYSLKDMGIKTSFTMADFTTEDPSNRWKLREPLLICHEKDFAQIRNLFKSPA